ncbi:MAG: hypothetical protein LC631_08860 [Desulfovibrionales bacterium]|nr:hypothetical protein [Desulfovibrionales bacterium]
MNTRDKLDDFSNELIDYLYSESDQKIVEPDEEEKEKVSQLLADSFSHNLTGNIVELFKIFKEFRNKNGLSPESFDISRTQLEELAVKHQEIDEHKVSIGGRVDRALPIVQEAESRVSDYLEKKDAEAPSGIELWEQISANHFRIRQILGMNDKDWNSFSGQLKFAIESLDTLGRILNLPAKAMEEVSRVTSNYRMRLTPYYAGLILPEKINDPVLLQQDLQS